MLGHRFDIRLIFLIIFLINKRVISLQCYECSACDKHGNGWSTASSSSPDDSCFKYAYRFGSVSYDNRGIRSSCSETTDSGGGTYYCCRTDFCNQSSMNYFSLTLILSSSFVFLFQ